MKKKPSTVTEVTFSINEEHQGCELRFPEPPGKTVTGLMSQHGWHFNKGGWTDPRWYKKQSPEAETFGKNLATLLNRKAANQPVTAKAPAPKIESGKAVNMPLPTKQPQPVASSGAKTAKTWFD
jgi:hypothetical protein